MFTGQASKTGIEWMKDASRMRQIEIPSTQQPPQLTSKEGSRGNLPASSRGNLPASSNIAHEYSQLTSSKKQYKVIVTNSGVLKAVQVNSNVLRSKLPKQLSLEQKSLGTSFKLSLGHKHAMSLEGHA